MSRDHPLPFWHHGSEAEERGAERFHWLRRDAASTPSVGRVGYILQDLFGAIGQGKPYAVLAADARELMVPNWNIAAPAQLAVQALYYDLGDAHSLLRAQRGQLDYFKATGQWLPLVRFAVTDGRAAFGFSQQEQLYDGYQVAARLNARYARTESRCGDDGAAYDCGGVLVRTTDVGDFHAWDPSPNSERGNGVSFTYMRADIETRQFYTTQGFVVRELAYPARQPLTLRCIFPYDAWTGGASDYCDFRPSCASLQVTSVEAWKTRYLATPASSCYFQGTPDDYQLALDVRNRSGAQDEYGWSEVILATWPQDIGDQLPLEAFVHAPGYHGSDGVQGAQRFQRDYLTTHQRYLPVLAIVPRASDGKPFSFDPEEQSVP